MGRRFLMALFGIICLLALSPGSLGQTGTVIVKPSIDGCSRTKLVISLFRKTPLPDKVLFVLKDSAGEGAEIIASQELPQQTGGKYHWAGIISFRDYIAELYSSDKKILLGRYSFNIENSAKGFITDKLSEILQLRQGGEEGGGPQDSQIIQVTNINIFPGATLMQILILTDKGGVVAQYLGPPVKNWSSAHKVPAGTYKKVILQFNGDRCRLT